jgi:regulatory protein
MAMSGRRPRKPRPPLDAAKLDELALSYVGRFATSRSKLLSYLNRKLRERGWAGDGEPPLQPLVERLARLGYVDDRAYALSKARSLTSRGYGERRVSQVMAVAGIDDEDRKDAREFAEGEAVEAALRFARRRAIGAFASVRPDPKGREKALAAMIRAGHGFALSRAIVELNPGDEIDSEALANLR